MSNRNASATAVGGDLFVVSAPSGSGKTTLIRALYASGAVPDLFYSVSHTTRSRRPNEVNGQDYHFVDEPTFRRMIEDEEFFEWAEVHGQLKGTHADTILRHVATGGDALLDLDVQGAEQVRSRVPNAQLIFILPPSANELARRLRRRGADDPQQIARRLADSAREVRKCWDYDYVIVNDRIERATSALAAIITARRHRRTHQRQTIERIVAEFAPG